MGCATSVVKYLVFLANLIFALAGLGLMIVGILFKVRAGGVHEVLPSDFALAPICTIVVGAIVFVTAFLGCCGAVKESPCMLTTYAIILLTIFILQVALAVYAFIQIKNQDDLQKEERKAVNDLFRYYNQNFETIDLTQSLLKCCGVDGPSYWGWQNNTVPSSCCEDKSPQCAPTYRPGYSAAYNKGCVQALDEFLNHSAKIVGGVVIGIALLEILGAVFGLCLASSIRNQYRRNIYEV